MRKIIISVLLISLFSCHKVNHAVITPIATPHDTTYGIDYSNFASVKNATAYSSSIDSISISDTIYHPSHTDSLFYIIFGYTIWFDETNYYNIPTRENCDVKFYLTVGKYYNPIQVTIFQPDGTYIESTEVLKFPGKDSATFKMNVSNKVQVSLSHI